MKSLRYFTRFLGILIVAVVAFFFVFNYYSWIFAKRVKGEVIEVERVMAPTAIFGKATDAQIHSYSILIKNEADGRLYTTSSEDRQWQVVKKGYCVEAMLYRYPFWDLEKANTFFNARVVELKLCPGQTEPPPSTPTPQPEPAPLPGQTQPPPTTH